MSKCIDTFLEKIKPGFDAVNGGKPISVGAFARLIREVIPTFKGSDQDVAQIFFEADVDHDKTVSWGEFVKLVTARDPKEVGIAELEAKFQSLDKDRSGKLDAGEVLQLCREVNVNISEEQIASVIADVDCNKDGFIDMKEFLAALCK